MTTYQFFIYQPVVSVIYNRPAIRIIPTSHQPASQIPPPPPTSSPELFLPLINSSSQRAFLQIQAFQPIEPGLTQITVARISSVQMSSFKTKYIYKTRKIQTVAGRQGPEPHRNSRQPPQCIEDPEHCDSPMSREDRECCKEGAESDERIASVANLQNRQDGSAAENQWVQSPFQSDFPLEASDFSWGRDQEGNQEQQQQGQQKQESNQDQQKQESNQDQQKQESNQEEGACILEDDCPANEDDEDEYMTGWTTSIPFYQLSADEKAEELDYLNQAYCNEMQLWRNTVKIPPQITFSSKIAVKHFNTQACPLDIKLAEEQIQNINIHRKTDLMALSKFSRPLRTIQYYIEEASQQQFNYGPVDEDSSEYEPQEEQGEGYD